MPYRLATNCWAEDGGNGFLDVVVPGYPAHGATRRETIILIFTALGSSNLNEDTI